VIWTLGVVALIAGVAAYSTVLLYQVDALPTSPGEYVDITGHQWYWEFYYPANHTDFTVAYDAATGGSSGGALWASPGESVQINVTSADVIHSFNIPGIGVRIDAIPGRVNLFSFNAPQAAAGTEYLIQCTEFCGAFHGTMRAYMVIT
jgi:heme/copper-type cytochrome/quinol oxidase subunit 2